MSIWIIFYAQILGLAELLIPKSQLATQYTAEMTTKLTFENFCMITSSGFAKIIHF